MSAWLDDLRYGARRLRHSPGFTLIAIATLAIGIGANVTIFGFASALLLEPLPGHEPDRLVRVYLYAKANVPYPVFREARAQTRTLPDLAAFREVTLSLRTGGEPEAVFGSMVTGNYFDVLRLPAAQGRLFDPQDDRPGAPAVAVLSDALWRRRFGGDPGAVGRTVGINGHPHTIVGIAPPGFRGTMHPIDSYLWVPMHGAAGRTDKSLQLLGRLSPGRTIPEVRAELTAIAARLEIPGAPKSGPPPFMSVYPGTRLGPEPRQFAQVFTALLLGLAGLVLLITCVNLSGLQLTRGLARRHEIGVRIAVGADRRRLVRLLLGESLLLSMAGGAVAALASFFAGRALVRLPFPAPIPVSLEFAFDARLLVFATALSFATMLAFGLAPALQATKLDVVTHLKAGSYGGSRSRLRASLIVAQVALSALLIALAGQLVRGMNDPRFTDKRLVTEGVVTAELDLRTVGYAREEGVSLQQRLLDRLAADGRVRAASLAQDIPLSGNNRNGGFRKESTSLDEKAIYPNVIRVSASHFATLGIPLLAGRDFQTTDGPASPAVAIVNETLARRLWPGESPVGKRLQAVGGEAPGPWIEVVGLARDSKYVSLGEDPRPMLYQAATQGYLERAYLLVKTDAPAAAAMALVREHVFAVAPELPVSGGGSLAAVTNLTALPLKIAARLAGALGALALLLVVIGMYGLMSQVTQHRAREIGIRAALGATAGELIRGMVGQGLRLVAVGLVIGLMAALGAGVLVRALLSGVSAWDPMALAGSAAGLVAAAYAASSVPVRRAVRSDAVAVLRE